MASDSDFDPCADMIILAGAAFHDPGVPFRGLPRRRNAPYEQDVSPPFL